MNTVKWLDCFRVSMPFHWVDHIIDSLVNCAILRGCFVHFSFCFVFCANTHYCYRRLGLPSASFSSMILPRGNSHPKIYGSIKQICCRPSQTYIFKHTPKKGDKICHLHALNVRKILKVVNTSRTLTEQKQNFGTPQTFCPNYSSLNVTNICILYRTWFSQPLPNTFCYTSDPFELLHGS